MMNHEAVVVIGVWICAALSIAGGIIGWRGKRLAQRGAKIVKEATSVENQLASSPDAAINEWTRGLIMAQKGERDAWFGLAVAASGGIVAVAALLTKIGGAW